MSVCLVSMTATRTPLKVLVPEGHPRACVCVCVCEGEIKEQEVHLGISTVCECACVCVCVQVNSEGVSGRL